ncbi:MAG: PhnD/SsuA/transferrin family substrate-binding protein [Melioribacter sp.]|uniref:PhnD/SsuA/transferrin family substrate-binding protein n=1 Tax=Rosettibacter primus TaxID=3111523 RepID=UPI00247BB151|nr:PhnD/SsuA/transferrin family substrate-binding protein [Melioribacter sp.]
MQSINKRVIIFLFLIILGYYEITALTQPDTVRWGFYFTSVDEVVARKIGESLRYWVEFIKNKSNDKRVQEAVFISRRYTSIADFLQDVRKNKIEVISFPSLTYFKSGINDYFYPALTISKSQESKYEKYLIISSEKAENNIEKLKNAELYTPKLYTDELLVTWIKSKFNINNSSKKNKIKIIKTTKTEIQLIISVFFNTINYAVVSEASFQLAKELNPQIKNKVKVLSVSPDFLYIIISFNKKIKEYVAEKIMELCLNIHKSVEGRQILNLIQAERFFSINESDLDETKKLVKFNQTKIN